jgi:hypothetical protein
MQESSTNAYIPELETGMSAWGKFGVPYNAAARDALQSANLRRPAILRYASWAAVFPISQGWSGAPSMAAITIDPDIDVMCHEEPHALQQAKPEPHQLKATA